MAETMNPDFSGETMKNDNNDDNSHITDKDGPFIVVRMKSKPLLHREKGLIANAAITLAPPVQQYFSGPQTVIEYCDTQ